MRSPDTLFKYRVRKVSETVSLRNNKIAGWRKRAVAGPHKRVAVIFFTAGYIKALAMSPPLIADPLPHTTINYNCLRQCAESQPFLFRLDTRHEACDLSNRHIRIEPVKPPGLAVRQMFIDNQCFFDNVTTLMHNPRCSLRGRYPSHQGCSHLQQLRDQTRQSAGSCQYQLYRGGD